MNSAVPSDRSILDLLRRQDRMTVSDFEAALGVTATAVRQRLNRLLAQGQIQRQVESAAVGRGRPSHWYTLTDSGRRKTGSNFADLAMVLWSEMRAISDAEIRRGLLERIAARLAEQYADQVRGATLAERMKSLAGLLEERQVPFEVQQSEGQLPVLTALVCPYPELAEQDRGICAMERMLFSNLLGEKLHLDQCRLDGRTCCTFAVPAVAPS